MKYLFILLLFASVGAVAQSTINTRNLTVSDRFRGPIKDTVGTTYGIGELRVRPQDSLMYRFNGRAAGRKWDLVLDTRSVNSYAFVPTTRTLTIQGVTWDLSEDRTWNPVDTVSIVVTQSDLPALVAALQVGISNAGDGNGGDSLVKVLSESELLVKRIKAGANISVTNVGDTILEIAAGTYGTLVTVTDANYSVASGVATVRMDALTAARTVTLPSAASNSGRKIRIKHTGSGAFNVNLSPSVRRSNLVTESAIAQGDWMDLESNGTDWVITADSN